MNRGRSLSQAHSPAPSVSLSCGWNKLQLVTLAVPMVAEMDESPLTVKLSDARHTLASWEREACNLATQLGVAERGHTTRLAVPVVGRSWVRVHSPQLPPSQISSWSFILIYKTAAGIF